MAGPFLTQLDSRAQVKGSRDPLGTQPIWSSFGRQVVGNLTTVSTSVRDFTTLLLGYWFAEKLPDHQALDVFLRWEQWAAYARTRFAEESGPPRGVDRVKARLRAGKPITISAEGDHQILSQQKTYGLWGIYSSPAAESGLLELGDEHRILTDAARRFVEKEYAPKLMTSKKGHVDWLGLLARKSMKCDWDHEHEPMLRVAASVLKNPVKSLTPGEMDFYRKHLLHGGPAGEADPATLQQSAASCVPDGLDDGRLSPAAVESWRKTAKRQGYAELERRLSDIQVVESVMAPATVLFSYLAGQSGTKMADVIANVTKSWKGKFTQLKIEEFEALRKKIDPSTPGKNGGESWVALASALKKNDFNAVTDRLLFINESVMNERGGAAWITRESGHLQVRYGENGSDLVAADNLDGLWRHSYFLDSLAKMAAQLRLP